MDEELERLAREYMIDIDTVSFIYFIVQDIEKVEEILKMSLRSTPIDAKETALALTNLIKKIKK